MKDLKTIIEKLFDKTHFDYTFNERDYIKGYRKALLDMKNYLDEKESEINDTRND